MTTRSCFVIAPIGSEGTETRKRSDLVLNYIIKEALVPKGYTVVRADEIAKPGSITTQVIEQIIKADLVVADLTEHNPNVFYELAVRHAVQKPLLHMIAADERIPFDVPDFRTITIELDLDGAAKARKELIAQVDEVEKGTICVTPVSLAGMLLELGNSSSEDKVVLRRLLEGLGELRAENRDLMHDLLVESRRLRHNLRIELERLRRSAREEELQMRMDEAKAAAAMASDETQRNDAALRELIERSLKNTD